MWRHSCRAWGSHRLHLVQRVPHSRGASAGQRAGTVLSHRVRLSARGMAAFDP